MMVLLLPCRAVDDLGLLLALLGFVIRMGAVLRGVLDPLEKRRYWDNSSKMGSACEEVKDKLGMLPPQREGIMELGRPDIGIDRDRERARHFGGRSRGSLE